MDADPFDLVGDLIDGQFRVDAVAGEGDLSVVYRGWHQGVSATVAIKCLNLPATLDPELVEPFVQSFREGTKLHYRLARRNLHIAQSLASGTTLAPRTGHLIPYLVREWFEGESLAATFVGRRARNLRGYTVEETLALLAGAADGLAFAHAEGVTHHSINPSNLFVVDSGPKPSVKLLDFGVARAMNDRGGRSAGLRVLMPEYAAPEQIDGQIGAVGPWTDVYALALIVMEALAGRPLFESKERAPTAQVDPKRRPSIPRGGVSVRKAVEDVLARAVALEPAKRPQDVASFWTELKEAAARPARVVSHAAPENISVRPGKLPPPPPLPKILAPRALRSAVPSAPTARPLAASAPVAVAVPVSPGPRGLPSSAPTMDLPSNLSIARKTIAGLGGERLPALPVVEPLATGPPPVPRQEEDARPARTTLVADVSPPRDFAPTDVDPEDPERVARGASRPSFAPAAGVRRLRLLVIVAAGGSVAALFALAGLTLYVVTSLGHARGEGPSASTSVSAPMPTVAADATTTSGLPVASPSMVPSVPPVIVAKRFTRAAGLAALDTVNAGLATCARKGGHTGTGSVRVTFNTDGSVMHISMGPPFQGTPEGVCVADRFRGARVAPFGGPVGALNYNFTVAQQQ